MDPQYFPTDRMREIIEYLHKHNQRYGICHKHFHLLSVLTGWLCPVLMVDPAVAYAPGEGYETFDRGTEIDLWVKTENGSSSFGVVWPGMS